jgi:hypothetical protein
MTIAVPAAKRHHFGGYLNPKLPPKSLWRNHKSVGIKDKLEHAIIFSAEELNSHYSLPVHLNSSVGIGIDWNCRLETKRPPVRIPAKTSN